MASEPTQPTVEKKIEELSDEEEDVPSLEPAEENAELASGGKRQNRGEKKIRKHLAKSGLKEVTGYNKLVVKKGGATIFVVTEPDVFKSPSGEIFVIFGEPKVENANANALANAAESFTNPAAALGEDVPELVSESTPAAASSEEGVDETGLSAKDIELVMAQGNCTRAKAVQALRNTKGDIVTAIMELTMSS